MLTLASTPPPGLPELEELELLDEELLDEELLEEEVLDELELLLEELLLELEDELLELELELEELPPTGPLQSPALALPLTLMLSIFARPALLVASRRIRLLPATRFTLTEPEPFQLVHEPVVSKGKLAAVEPLTIRLAERALAPFANTKLML